jgi:transposase
MAMGRKKDLHGDLFVATQDLPTGEGHLFYDKLNQFLGKHHFDRQVEAICQAYYDDGSRGGRPSLPPGTYFRMLFIGYFEGIGSQRGIAWRCADSLALRRFLGIPLTASTPDHSTLTYVRQRLPEAVHDQVMGLILSIAREEKLLRGEELLVDSTLVKANAAMESIRNKQTGQTYQAYLKQLAADEGLPDAPANELRNFDKKRPDKSCSNQDWESPSDPEARITKMKDGTTDLAYKLEHAVELESGLIVAAPVYPATAHDTATLEPTVRDAQINLVRAESDAEVTEVGTDKGYFALETLQRCEALGVRTYVSERKPPRRKGRRRPQYKWTDKSLEAERCFRNNRRRVRSDQGKRFLRRRGELLERSFAHVCQTGAGRRTTLRGRANVQKRHLALAMAFNLGVLMRKLFKMGTPRSLQGLRRAFVLAWKLGWRLGEWISHFLRSSAPPTPHQLPAAA